MIEDSLVFLYRGEEFAAELTATFDLDIQPWNNTGMRASAYMCKTFIEKCRYYR